MTQEENVEVMVDLQIHGNIILIKDHELTNDTLASFLKSIGKDKDEHISLKQVNALLEKHKISQISVRDLCEEEDNVIESRKRDAATLVQNMLSLAYTTGVKYSFQDFDKIEQNIRSFMYDYARLVSNRVSKQQPKSLVINRVEWQEFLAFRNYLIAKINTYDRMFGSLQND